MANQYTRREILKIAAFSAVSGMPKLSGLYLKIAAFSAVSGMPKLSGLYVEDVQTFN